MGIYIYQPDVLDKLTAVEGEGWKKQQVLGQVNDAFQYILKAWFELQIYKIEHHGDADGIEWQDFVPDRAETVIYGNGGWNRYQVKQDGEIIYLEFYGKPKRELAESVGFTVR